MDNITPEQSDDRPLADWTRELAEGSDEAWRWFHRRYYLPLLRYAARCTSDASAASDIVQEAYLRIARHAKPFAKERDFSNWLRCIVRCTATDHARKNARRSLLAEKFAHWLASRNESDNPSSSAASNGGRLADEALAKLPVDDAELLRSKYCEGNSTEELARERDTTPKAIEHRLARLRVRLREIILRLQ